MTDTEAAAGRKHHCLAWCKRKVRAAATAGIAPLPAPPSVGADLPSDKGRLGAALAEDYLAHVIGIIVFAHERYLVAGESDVEVIAVRVLPTLVGSRFRLGLDGGGSSLRAPRPDF